MQRLVTDQAASLADELGVEQVGMGVVCDSTTLCGTGLRIMDM